MTNRTTYSSSTEAYGSPLRVRNGLCPVLGPRGVRGLSKDCLIFAADEPLITRYMTLWAPARLCFCISSDHPINMPASSKVRVDKMVKIILVDGFRYTMTVFPTLFERGGDSSIEELAVY